MTQKRGSYGAAGEFRSLLRPRPSKSLVKEDQACVALMLASSVAGQSDPGAEGMKESVDFRTYHWVLQHFETWS